MKKIAMAIAMMALCIGALSARDTEVSASYGAEAAMEHMPVYSDHWHGMNHAWGTFSFTIDHRFAQRLWVGLSYTLSTARTDHARMDRGGNVTWHGLLVNARYEWYTRKSLTLYSHAGIGVLVSYMNPGWEPAYNQTHLGFQASPIGAQWDVSRHVGLFAEAGYGIQGIVKVGVRVGW